MASQIVCKILYNEETRRITLARLSYADLLGKLREVGIPEDAQLRVVYTDQDEDNITVASDADLADALSFSSTGSLRLKLLPSATRLFDSNPAASPAALNPLDSSTVLRMLSNVEATGDFTALLGNLATLLPPGCSGLPSESLIADLQAAAANNNNNNQFAPEEVEEQQEELNIPDISSPSLTPDASFILRLLSNADSSAQFASLLGDVGAFLPSSAVPSDSPAPSDSPVNFTELIAALGPVLQELGPQIAALGPQIEALGPQIAALGPQLAALTPMLNNLAERVGPQLNALGAQVAPQVQDIVAQVSEGLNALGEQVEPQVRALGEQVIPQLEEIGTQAFQSLASEALLSSFAEPPAAEAPAHVENSQDVRAILAALSLNEETIQNILENAGNDPETAIALANALTNN